MQLVHMRKMDAEFFVNKIFDALTEALFLRVARSSSQAVHRGFSVNILWI